MSFKIDLKLVVATTIFIGFFLGFYVDNTIYSKPRIESLSTQVDEQNTTIGTLSQQLSTLQSEHETLTAEYEEYLENNVDLIDYEELQAEADTLAAEIASLEEQIDLYSTTVDNLEDELDDLEAEHYLLSLEHSSLQERYDEIYNPRYVAFSYNGLDVNLTVNEIWYQGNTPIEGRVTVRHSNGDLFEGTYKIKVSKVYLAVSYPSDYFEIHGISDYSWSSPFSGGAGSYKLLVSELRDSEGAPAIPSHILNGYFINVFMG